MTREEQIEKFVDDLQPSDIPDITYLLRKAIDYGYALAALEVAERDSGRKPRA